MARPSVETQRRAQILAAACEIVSEIGIQSLRVADVAKRADTSTGTVHYYFDTKHELLNEMFEFNLVQSLERRQILLDSVPRPSEQLRVFVESFLPDGPVVDSAWRVWVELWVAALHDPELQAINDRVYGEWRRIVVAIIEAGQRAGEIRLGDPALMGNALIGMVDGLSLQHLVGSSSITLEHMREVCDEVLAGFEAKQKNKTA